MEQRRPAALPLGPTAALPAAAPMCRRRIIELDARRELKARGVRPGAACGALAAPTRSMRCSTTSRPTATALTLGIHSRIDGTVEHIVARLPHGNVYVNRNMIGAVVGTQPFGGTALVRHRAEGGRPELSAAVCAEQVVTVNTAAAGGNASLLRRRNRSSWTKARAARGCVSRYGLARLS